MTTPIQPPTVIFVERTRLCIYSPKLPGVISFPYPPKIILDLDVKNIEELRSQIKNFVDRGKVAPSTFIMILANSVCFEKNFPLGNTQDSQKFIDAVPFDYVRFRTYTIGKNSKVVVANRDFYEALDIAFERLGFTTIAICPLSALGLVLPPAGFDANLGKALIQKVELVKDQGFYAPGAPTAGQQQETKTSEKKRVAILLCIFGLLIVILGIVLVMALQPSPPPAVLKDETAKPPSEAVTTPAPNENMPLPIAPVSSESGNLDYRVLILNGSQTPGQADQIKKQLKSIGFTDITVSNSTQSASVRTEITFNNLVKPEVIDKIIQELQKTFFDISSKEAPPSGFDIRIVTGTAKVTAP